MPRLTAHGTHASVPGDVLTDVAGRRGARPFSLRPGVCKYGPRSYKGVHDQRTNPSSLPVISRQERAREGDAAVIMNS